MVSETNRDLIRTERLERRSHHAYSCCSPYECAISGSNEDYDDQNDEEEDDDENNDIEDSEGEKKEPEDDDDDDDDDDDGE